MEQKLLSLMNQQWTSPALDRVMAGLSSFHAWAIPLLILALLVFIVGGFRARVMLIVLGLTLGFSDGVAANFLKRIVQRPRPHEVMAGVRRVELRRAQPAILALFKTNAVKITKSRLTEPQQNGRSFPSSHVMNNFCAAIVVTAFYRRRGWLAFIVAAGVAYSRVYVGSHWPTDVAISILLATGLTLLLLAAYEWIWRRLAPRLAPQTFAAHPTLVGIVT